MSDCALVSTSGRLLMHTYGGQDIGRHAIVARLGSGPIIGYVGRKTNFRFVSQSILDK